MKNYYNILNISTTADIFAIRKAFRRRAKSCHPDLFQNLSLKEQMIKQKEFVNLTQAYQILSNPDKRKIFDRQLAQSESNNRHTHEQKTRRSSSFSSFKGRFEGKKTSSKNNFEYSTSCLLYTSDAADE